MEIEKKYLVSVLPEGLGQYEKWEIEQGYLCTSPTLRIRKKNDEYILTYKNRGDGGAAEKLNISDEIEIPLSEDAYRHLKYKVDGRCIYKTRYRIPYGTYTIELDVFHDFYEGFVLAEVEFSSIEESRAFSPPEWFDDDVSGDYHYTNSYMAQI